MRMNRFFGDFDFSEKIIRVFDKTLANQLKNVLRTEINEQLILCDRQGNEAIAILNKIDKNESEFEIISVGKNEKEPERYVSLYCSMLKRENFEWVVQKATEIGIKEIVPLICARTIKTGFSKERLEKIIKEACEQSGRGILPILNSPLFFNSALTFAKENNNINIFFDTEEDNKNNFPNLKNKKVGLFIGPEGGFNEKEKSLAHESNFKMTSLGKLVLRAETAAVVASYLAIHN